MKPSLAKGTRDFLPEETRLRQYIFQVMKDIFELFDFQMIETPAIENLSTLQGKYGEEGDRLLFKILNNGDYLSGVDQQALIDKNSQAVLPQISKRGLRYDLTVPLARFVALHQNDISFPFKRYQIQPVWRADRPQKGRYQEFYQCDVDIIGSDSLVYEAELIQVYDWIFHRLKIPVQIRWNHRGLLYGIASAFGVNDEFERFTTILDKFDKLPRDKFEQQMIGLGVSPDCMEMFHGWITQGRLEDIRNEMMRTAEGQRGVKEVEEVLSYLEGVSLHNELQLDLSLARGLNYYTGCIFEVTCPSVQIGSVGGGGRYADLTGIFGLANQSGVGISFGAARIYDVMKELQLEPKDIKRTSLMISSMDEASLRVGVELVHELRTQGVSAALYPTPAKMNKQLKYAHQRGIPFVAIIGEQERRQDAVTLKNMQEGIQRTIPRSELAGELSNNLSSG